MSLKRACATCCLLAAAAVSMPCGAAQWIGTWGAAPLPPSPALGPFPATPAFSNQTIRQVVRVSAGGQRLRIRFSNEYGTKPLTIGKATVALADASGAVQKGTERPLTFGGSGSVSIPAAAPFLSDPVDLPVAALSSVSVSVYLPEETPPCTCHATGMATGYVSAAGDFTGGSFEPKERIQRRAYLSGVEMESPSTTTVLAGGVSTSTPDR